MRLHYAIVAPLLLTACATQPAGKNERPASAANVQLSQERLKPGPGRVQLTITRDRGLYGAACPALVYVNGRQVAKLAPSENVVLYEIAGYTILGIKSGGLCSAAATNEIAITTDYGQPRKYRVTLAEDGSEVSSFKIMPTAF